MNTEGFNRFYWGFLFIMIDFRIQGIDVLPDIIGYILFAVGFKILVENSEYFKKAANFNIAMIVLSIFAIYEQPVQGSGINFGPLGPFGIIIGIASIAVNLFVVFNLFHGIKDMAEKTNQSDIFEQAAMRWKQYFYLQIAAIFVFPLIFIPFVAFIYIFALLIVSIVLTIAIMGFMKNCGERL